MSTRQTVVIYSSKTGNTKKVATAIAEALEKECELSDVAQNPNPEDYDLIFMGFWVDKGMPNKESLDYMNNIKNKKVALFATLGDYANTEHAQKSLGKGADSLGDNCEIQVVQQPSLSKIYLPSEEL